MSKYRIVKLGDTNTYIIQKRVLWLFWYTRFGTIIVLSLSEARDYVEMFEKDDELRKKRKAKNTIVPNRAD